MTELELLKIEVANLSLELSIVSAIVQDHLNRSGDFRDELLRIVATKQSDQQPTPVLLSDELRL